MTEAVSGMLDKARSGREAVQAQNQEAIILRLGPTLNEGLAMKKVPEFRIGCYMLLSIMASKGGLNDKLLTAMMEAVVLGWTADTFVPGLVCLSILAQQRGAKQMTKRVTRELLKVDGLPELLLEISKTRRIDKLANGIVLALVDRLGKSGDATVLPLVGHIVQNQLLSEAQETVVVKSLLLVAYRLDEEVDPSGSVRRDLAGALTTLAEYPGQPGVIARKAMEDASVDIDELELKLQASIRPKLIQAAPDGDVEMGDADETSETQSADFHTLLQQLPTDDGNDTSFLSRSETPTFQKFMDVFLSALATKENLDEFDQALKTQKSQAVRYFSFYIRVWCGPYPVLARTAALERSTQSLNDAMNESLDLQGLIPYVIIALGDSALKVRRAASALALGLSTRYPADAELKKTKGLKPWADKSIYGRGKNVSWMTVENAARLLRDIICPGLEECVIDKKHIVSIVEKSLNGPKDVVDSPKKQTAKHSQALRLATLTNLASHVVSTPLYAAKYKLLVVLNEVRGVSTTTRTKLLLPVLQDWAAQSPQAAKENCEAEQVDITAYNDEAVAVVVPNDEEGFQVLASIAQGEVAPGKESLCAAVFRRIRNMWPSLKGDARLNTAQLLMDLSQPPSDDARHSEFAQAEAMELLRTVNLTTDILLSFLNQLPTAAQLADTPPATKRRRVSHGEIAKTPVQDMKSLTDAVHKVSFVLQMVDNSNPEKHVALLPGLFNALSELQHFKSQVGSELGYLQGLVLSSLLSIMQAHKADPRLKLDRSAVRADLLVDCVQKTASPQVQNAALLLIANLASTAPELVLHSVMPIFTFMGSSVLRQNDEYSAHVIKQTIAEVIPPLITSLRKEKGGPVTGAAELLLSFVAAYEHVPAHRRKGLYTSLVQTLGPEDFLFAVLGMLADKYGATESIKAFSVDLASSFSVDVQLQTAVKYLDLAADLLKPKPTISAVLLGSSESSTTDAHRSALTQLTLLPHLLSEKKLIDQTARLLQHDDMDASRVRELYSTLLENLLSLSDQVKADKKLHNACGNVLERVLGLLSTSEFVKSVESLLDRPNEELRRKILRSLEVRVDQEKQSNVAARQAMLAFLPQLTAIIRESGDILYKHIAVTCVDKISEKYGKKDLEAVAVAAETIAGEKCLGQDDERLQVMSLLCLASLVDILREGIVSVLPIAIPAALQYMAKTVEEGGQNDKLHNAGYAFINALVEHLPYMISGNYLDTLLVISNKSAEADLEVEADESRIACLDLAAKQIEAKNMFTALQKNWSVAVECGTIVSCLQIRILNPTNINRLFASTSIF
jgi:U3 small nucleolar RNA-associated protein 10